MTLFSRIIAGEIPCHKVAETDEFFAFLDINPVQKGHVLVVPKREEDYFFDLSSVELQGLIAFAQKIAVAVRSYTKCRKVAVSVIGLEVNHAHLHLIPINKEGDLDFRNKLTDITPEELASIAEGIRRELVK